MADEIFTHADVAKYSPDQPRDDQGQWSAGGGGSAAPMGTPNGGASGAAERPTGGTTRGKGTRPGEKPESERDLLGIGGDFKTVKGEKQNVATGIMYLSPADESGVANLCPFASPDCKADCLKSSGRMIMEGSKNSRMWKTKALKEDPKGFVDRLGKEVKSLERATSPDGKGRYKGFTPAIRLNGTSDLPWENMKGTEGKNLMEMYPKVQFYDYTKNPKRIDEIDAGKFPKNYHLTFSRSELNDPASKLFNPKFGNIDEVLKRGNTNVAVVFDTPTDRFKDGEHKGEYENALPQTFKGYPVIDGDLSDLRFMDPKGGHIIGLRGKGAAKHDRADASKFVIPTITLKPGLKPKGETEKAAGMTRVLSQDPNLVAASDRWLPSDCIHGE